MAVVSNPRSSLPGKLRGLHLFHYGGAPCPQRVRFVLAEKGIRRGPSVPWQSAAPEHLEAAAGSYIARPVSLPRQQNLTEAYAAIHPHMVVPALVHDGVLHIESVDIMNYIDSALPGPPLVPEGAAEACRDLIAKASALQTAVRHLTYRWSLGGLAKLKSQKLEELDRLDAEDSPERLSVFYRAFSRGEISDSTYLGHVRSLEDGFAEIEALLAGDGRTWLTGEHFSMADIIWSVKMLRIFETGYPFEKNFPGLGLWFERVRARPTFEEAIWRDVKIASRVFRFKGRIQNLFGRGLEAVASEPAAGAR
jgi:glutathione S-transferase